MNNLSIEQALQIIRPGAEWVMRGGNYENLEWLDTKQSKPTLAEIEAAPAPKEPSVADKLASVGLNLDDLKVALGL